MPPLCKGRLLRVAQTEGLKRDDYNRITTQTGQSLSQLC